MKQRVILEEKRESNKMENGGAGVWLKKGQIKLNCMFVICMDGCMYCM